MNIVNMAHTPLGLELASAECLRRRGATDGRALQGQLHFPITHLLDLRLISRKISPYGAFQSHNNSCPASFITWFCAPCPRPCVKSSRLQGGVHGYLVWHNNAALCLLWRWPWVSCRPAPTFISPALLWDIVWHLVKRLMCVFGIKSPLMRSQLNVYYKRLRMGMCHRRPQDQQMKPGLRLMPTVLSPSHPFGDLW